MRGMRGDEERGGEGRGRGGNGREGRVKGRRHSLERLEGRHRLHCDPNSNRTAIVDWCSSENVVSSRVRAIKKMDTHWNI
jgi:hypothetical protein